MVMAQITNYIDLKLQSNISLVMIARDVWLDLEERFPNKFTQDPPIMAQPMLDAERR